MLVVLFIVSVLVFLLTNFIGDPVDMLVPENATLEQIESARARLGLDRPLPVQYGIFLNDVLHGNFGKSYSYGLQFLWEYMQAHSQKGNQAKSSCQVQSWEFPCLHSGWA